MSSDRVLRSQTADQQPPEEQAIEDHTEQVPESSHTATTDEEVQINAQEFHDCVPGPGSDEIVTDKDAEEHATPRVTPSPFAKIPLPQLPPFNKDDTERWFRDLSTQLTLCKTVSESDKYIALLGYLDPHLRTLVQTWLEEEQKKRTVTHPFSFAKERLTQRFQLSERERLARLMNAKPGEDILPSEYLAELKQIAGDKHMSLAQEIWEDYLPESVTAMLHTTHMKTLPLESIASIVDGFFIANRRKKPSEVTQPTAQVSVVDQISNRLEKLEVFLTGKNFIPREKKFRKGNKPMTETNKQCNNKTEPQRPAKTSNELCRFHRKFGDKAFRCECPKN